MENKLCGKNSDNNTVFLSFDLTECLDNIDDVISIKSEPFLLGNTFEQVQKQFSDQFPTKIESVENGEILIDRSDYDQSSDLPLLNDDFKMSPSDCDYDIVNIDLLTSENRIRELLDMNSPGSNSSSHHSVLEELSVDSRPSTTHTLSTNPSVNELCAICNDLATGKHYGVSACEGCKGFFKRTIRKKLTFACREQNSCLVTEKLRNRCQACRFRKCIERGMKIEAVQRERPSKRKLSSFSSSSVDSPESVITADSIYRNELSSSSNMSIDSPNCEECVVEVEETKLLCSIINKQLFHLVMWAKAVPGFSQLNRGDQMILLNKSWVEIFLASVAFRSTLEGGSGSHSNEACSSIRVDDTYRLTVSVAATLGMKHLIVRIIRELVTALRSMRVDQMEMACLKIIILFDSNYADLQNTDLIREFRLSIFSILEKYTHEKHPRQPARTYKLLLKLSSIRGLTACFVQKMALVLNDCLHGNSSEPQNVEPLFPLLNEMMNQQHFPFSRPCD